MDNGHRMRFLPMVTVGLLATGVLTGCAADTGQPPASAPASPPGGTMTSEPPPSFRMPASRSSTPGPGADPAGSRPAPAVGELTLRGRVEAGVERGCLVLRTEGHSYGLMDGDPKIVYPGAHVVVTGHVLTGVMSYCQQGVPFQVTSARPG